MSDKFNDLGKKIIEYKKEYIKGSKLVQEALLFAIDANSKIEESVINLITNKSISMTELEKYLLKNEIYTKRYYLFTFYI